jgi:hypothetical protein
MLAVAAVLAYVQLVVLLVQVVVVAGGGPGANTNSPNCRNRWN